jgi:gliding motility-associated-like protein
LLLLSVTVHAQKQDNIWHFGRGCSMYFDEGFLVKTTATPSVQPHKFSDYIFKIATISSPTTGALLFYGNGRDVMNKNHQPMPNGKMSVVLRQVMIVPDALDSTQYFLFYITTNHLLRYAKIDMKLNGGLGDVVDKDHEVSGVTHHRFVVVKQLYGQGYWLIATGWGDSRFYAYRITGDAIAKPVISTTGPVMLLDGTDEQLGDMEATTDGNKFACTYKTATDNGRTGVYSFDKKCGMITFTQLLDAGRFYQSLAFDHTGQFLYVSTMRNGGNYELLQYDLFLSNPDISEIPVATLDGYSPIENMELGPDNRIYITTQEKSSGPSGGLSPAGKLHVVNKPWLKGGACSFAQSAIRLDPGVPCPDGLACRITNFLPDGVSDRSMIHPGFEPPQITTTQFCFGDETQFKVTNDFGADSLRWVFSDKDSVSAKNASYIYTTAEKHIATFKWYLCGFEYVKNVEVSIGIRPVVNLGNDTTLCHKSTMPLSGPAGADEYQWSTGDTDYTIVVKEPGIYALEVRNGACSNSDEVKVDYYPSLWIALGDEYFICDDEKELTRLDAGEGFVNYKWTPTGDTTQWIEVADLGEYFVVVKDFRGCDGNDGTKVKRRCPVKVYFPNAFTPNRDGINDEFVPVGKDVTAFAMTIYNRWGETVFTTNDIGKTWDGTYKNKTSQEGVYLYKAWYEGYRNKKLVSFDVSGNVTLLR